MRKTADETGRNEGKENRGRSGMGVDFLLAGVECNHGNQAKG